ncbi:MAG: polyphosphate kinase 2 [Rhizobiaceae bacterium]|nr:polyphosphate kinase 2 [Rhizobiaceae bacterium]MCV0405896.1 polyphosphate kinase 2 [Rhizobiaceae bacterium]
MSDKTSYGREKVEPIEIDIGGKHRVFDIEDPDLPDWIKDRALSSGGYPYDDKMGKKAYKAELELLQIELVKLQYWLQKTGERVMALFEGRDAAGKGGTIFVVRQYLNPRSARNVALTKPTETERGQWYFQRYVTHFPTKGEFVTFDRSWYNRGVVEPVMGFCTEAQCATFLEEAPNFERLIVDDGIRFFKFWLNIGQEMQLKRFHDRVHEPLKTWKFSPIDVLGMTKWNEYGAARDRMIERTHSAHAPWTVVRANDKKRARLAVMRRILRSIDYAGKDEAAIGLEDPLIIRDGSEFLASG